jgi:hypothetical protein
VRGELELESTARAAMADSETGEDEWLGLDLGEATPSGTSLSSTRARSSSAQQVPKVCVHFDAHAIQVSARGRDAWRLRTVWSKIPPMARAAAASAGTAVAGQGIAQRRRCVSQCASLLSAAANAVSRATRTSGISGIESLYSCRTASSTRESSRLHATGASARSCTRSSGRWPAVHSRKAWAGCSCPRWQSRQGRKAARGRSR